MKPNQSICINQKTDIDSFLYQFESVSLEEIKSVELMNRTEIKYIIRLSTLLEILNELPKHYKLLQIGNDRKTDYHTLYFDTPDFKMYKAHHNGKLNRYKIRLRKYLNSNLSFIEIKFKDNKEKTLKKRTPLSGDFDNFGRDIKKFISEKSPFNAEELLPVLFNDYTRITLVNKKNTERVTIDLNLEFSDKAKKKNIKLSDLVIIEIKQEKLSRKSDIVQLMHEKSIRPNGFSKYCIGASLIYEELKINNFKEKLIFLNKLNEEIKK